MSKLWVDHFVQILQAYLLNSGRAPGHRPLLRLAFALHRFDGHQRIGPPVDRQGYGYTWEFTAILVRAAQNHYPKVWAVR